MSLIHILKQGVHTSLHWLGLDLIKLSSLDAALEARERERLERQLDAIRMMRSKGKSVASLQANSPTAGGPTWVSASTLWESSCTLIADVQSVIDIGCAFRPQQLVDARIHICCEPCEEYMDRLICETSESGKFVYLKCNLIEASQCFPAGSVDSAFLIDVIEHVDREAALVSLERLKRITRKQIALFTPIGFMPQDPSVEGVDQWGMNGVEWQRHRSGWTPDDFPAAEGWTVVASKDFHKIDGYGRPLETPFGAMWAIWNRPQTDRSGQ